MSYSLSHFIQVWLLPPGNSLALMIVGLLIGWQHRLGKTLVIIAIVMLWLLSTPIIAYFLLQPLESQYSIITKLPMHSKDTAIVVLGGGSYKAPEENSEALSSNSLQRLHYALYLYQKTHWPIISSGGRLQGYHYSEADLIQRELQEYQHVSNPWTENQSITTQEEAKFILNLLQAHHIKKIYLVTNAYHMPRSMYVFQHFLTPHGIDVKAAPMGYVTIFYQDLTSYLPTLHGLATSTTALHEYIGLLWYL